MALRHAREQRRQGAGDLQHQRLDHPARVRRGALHPRRARDRRRLDQGVPHPARRLLPGRRSTSRRCAAPSSATRSPRSSTQLDADAGAGREVLDDREPVASWPATLSDAQVGALPRPARRLPGGARGCAQAQGARLHARRGLRRRRAQARADRADRGGPAGRRASCPPAGPRALHDKMRQQHPGDPGAWRAHHRDRRGGRRGRRAVRRRPDPDARRCPTLLQPLVATVPLQVFACELATARATTSTSRATWRSPSRSSRPPRRESGDRRRRGSTSVDVDAVRGARWSARPALRERLFTAPEREPPDAAVAGRPVRGEGGARQGARRAGRAALARRRGGARGATAGPRLVLSGTVAARAAELGRRGAGTCRCPTTAGSRRRWWSPRAEPVTPRARRSPQVRAAEAAADGRRCPRAR